LFGGYAAGWRHVASLDETREREAVTVLTDAGIFPAVGAPSYCAGSISAAKQVASTSARESRASTQSDPPLLNSLTFLNKEAKW
jgi:hypothetical protein